MSLMKITFEFCFPRLLNLFHSCSSLQVLFYCSSKVISSWKMSPENWLTMTWVSRWRWGFLFLYLKLADIRYLLKLGNKCLTLYPATRMTAELQIVCAKLCLFISVGRVESLAYSCYEGACYSRVLFLGGQHSHQLYTCSLTSTLRWIEFILFYERQTTRSLIGSWYRCPVNFKQICRFWNSKTIVISMCDMCCSTCDFSLIWYWIFSRCQRQRVAIMVQQ